MSDPIRLSDATKAMNRPLTVGHLGDLEIPPRIRPTVAQAVVLLGVSLGGIFGWSLIGSKPLGWLIPGWTVTVGSILVAFGLSLLVRVLQVDGRSAPRFVRSFLAHRTRSRGRDEGPWIVHGKAVDS